jgi:hypothetical protein
VVCVCVVRLIVLFVSAFYSIFFALFVLYMEGVRDEHKIGS